MPVIHSTCANHPARGRCLVTAALVAALATPAGARAAHPLLSDDAGTLGRGAAQLELAAEVVGTGGGVICAIADRLTLDVGVKAALTAPDVDLPGSVGWRGGSETASAIRKHQGFKPQASGLSKNPFDVVPEVRGPRPEAATLIADASGLARASRRHGAPRRGSTSRSRSSAQRSISAVVSQPTHASVTEQP